MTTCYICGRPFGATEWRFRHKLKTGESISRTYAHHKAVKIYSRYDLHLVCEKCHLSIVTEERRRMVVALGVVVFGVLALTYGVSLLYAQLYS